MVNKKLLAAAFTLTGTIIGAGILGLPYVFAKSGFLIGLSWLIILGIVMLLVNLYLGEICLRTNGRHQLTGYAKKYLGKNAEKIMLFAMLFGIFSALIAYLVGEGESLSQLITGTTGWAIPFAIAFWAVMTLLLKKGLKGLKKIETWGVITIIILVLGIFIWFFPKILMQNLTVTNPPHILLPIGVIIFALLGFTSIPEIKMELKGNEKYFKKAIIIGTIVPIILYILFAAVFVGVLGNNIAEVATLSFGPIVTLLGIFTMLTSYFVLSFSLKDMFAYDLKYSKRKTFVWVCLLPLILYLVISLFKLAGFIAVLGIGGVISGGITGILILLINKKSKERGKRKPEFELPINWFWIILLMLLFIFGIIAEMFL